MKKSCPACSNEAVFLQYVQYEEVGDAGQLVRAAGEWQHLKWDWAKYRSGNIRVERQTETLKWSSGKGEGWI